VPSAVADWPHRILILSHHGRTIRGGAPLADREIAETLRGLGHTVDLLFYDDVLPASIKATGRQLAFPWFAALAFLRGRHAARWDVIESTAGNAWVIDLLQRLLPGPRPLLSVRSHGLENRRAEMDQERRRREGVRTGLITRLYHFRYRLWEVARDLRRADAVFLLNKEDTQFAVENMGVPAAKIHTLPNGLPDRLLALPEPQAGPDRPFQLLFLGAWSLAKGVDLLPRIAARIFAADPRYRLTCAGVGETVESVLANFAPEDRQRVTVIPRYDWEELPGLLTTHGVFLFPSPAEGCSLALLEAMAGGLVPVTTRTGYAADILKPGRNGFLVEAGDAEGYAAAVLALAADPENASEATAALGRQARLDIAGQSWKSLMEERVRIWDSLIAKLAAGG
jgi:glycosyltransferase involved in cell wall biosynthesis